MTHLAGFSLIVLIATLEPHLLAGSQIVSADTQVVTTIRLPGARPVGVAVYEAGNRIAVMDDATGNAFIIDGTSHQILATLPVGFQPTRLVVDQAFGKLYVVSNRGCFCPGTMNDGNGRITVIDLNTLQVVKVLDTPSDHQFFNITPQHFEIAIDEARHKVYVSYARFVRNLAVIDVASDDLRVIPSASGPVPQFIGIKIHKISGEVFLIDSGNNRIGIYNPVGDSFSYFNLNPTGSRLPLDMEINETNNKLYLAVVFAPGQAEPSILVWNRNTNSVKFVGRDDLEPLAYNPRTNRLFSGVQVGLQGAILDGTTDAARFFDVGTFPRGGVFLAGIRQSTDTAYFVRVQDTLVVSGAQAQVVQTIPSGSSSQGGIFIPSIAINQRNGRVYVVNDQQVAQVMVLQDPTSAPSRPTLSVSRAGAGTGAVSGTGILCGTDCEESFSPDTSVALTPRADDGSYFDRWVGACTGRAACTVRMDLDQSVTAVFSRTRARSGTGQRVVTAVARAESGRMRTTLTAGCGSIREIRLTSTSNATVDFPGGPQGVEGSSSWLPPTDGPTVLHVNRKAQGAFTAILEVVDECGSWETFTGGGANVP